ncbi:NAD-dependent epimerase/dehydratase family protein [Streptomyces sp. NPDC048567]|uniref:NAD-dependent epimerase/dehydratase family protein n=1 Tax=unclassified Streptomyces TaxID=2593676 RepID=UPI0033D04A87
MANRAELPLLLVTGGFGRVASVVVPPLADTFRIHVLDRTEHRFPMEPDQVTTGELHDLDLVARAMHGVDAVLHLAANASPRSPWSVAMDNLTLARTVLDAAAAAHVATVVLASSVHAAGGAFRDGARPVDPATAHPCCAYGVGKAAMEAAAMLHHDLTGASVSSIRFGLTGWPLTTKELADTWLGDQDAADLVRRALVAPPHVGTYHGVSRHGSSRWAVGNAAEDLGWRPRQELPVALSDLPPAESAPCRMFAVRGTPPSPG